MAILGPDGQPATDLREYKVGSFGIKTPKPPEFFLQLAVQQAAQVIGQHDPVAAMQVRNPFQMAPAAQAVFMLAAEALAAQGERIAQLEAKLEGDRNDAPDGPSS